MSVTRQLFFVSLIGSILAAGACSNSTTSPSGSATTVAIPAGASTLTTTAFQPNPVTVSVGMSVRWSNSDSTAHTATADGGAWNSGNINNGGTFDFKFQSAGTFTYHCAIHPGMVGTVVVQ